MPLSNVVSKTKMLLNTLPFNVIHFILKYVFILKYISVSDVCVIKCYFILFFVYKNSRRKNIYFVAYILQNCDEVEKMMPKQAA